MRIMLFVTAALSLFAMLCPQLAVILLGTFGMFGSVVLLMLTE